MIRPEPASPSLGAPPLWRRMLPFVGTVVILAALFRAVDFHAFRAALADVPWRMLVGLLAFTLTLEYVVGTDKWYRTLRSMGARVPWRDLLWLRLAPTAIKFVLPWKSGELVRALWLARRGRTTFAVGLSSILFEKFVNFLGLVVWAALGMVVCAPPWLGVPAGCICAVLMIAYLVGERAAVPVVALLRRVSGRSADFTGELLGCIDRMSVPARIGLLAYTFVYQMRSIVFVTLLLGAMGYPVTLLETAAFMPLADIVASSGSITLAGLGLREAALVALMRAYAPPEALAAAAFVVSLLAYAMPALIGAPFTWVFLRQIAEPPVEAPSEEAMAAHPAFE